MPPAGKDHVVEDPSREGSGDRPLAAGRCAPAASSFLLWCRGGALQLQGGEHPWSWSVLACRCQPWRASPRSNASSEPGERGAVRLSPGTLKVRVSQFNFLGPRHSSKKEQPLLQEATTLVSTLWCYRLPSSLLSGVGGSFSRPGRKL